MFSRFSSSSANLIVVAVVVVVVVVVAVVVVPSFTGFYVVGMDCFGGWY